MFIKFKTFIEKYIEINYIEWKLIESALTIKEFKKGEIILFNGDFCKNLYFLNSGLARAYLIDENGKDYTWSLLFNDKNAHMVNLFVVDYDSFLHQIPANLYIEVLEDCEVVSVSYQKLQYLYNKSKKAERFGRYMVEEAYSYIHNHSIDMKIKSPKDRFTKLINSTPYLLNKVPQYHIASFLGITPQYLSQLKKEVNVSYESS